MMLKKTCNNEKNTNRFDIFLAQISATGTFKATKVNAVGIDFPNKSAIISTSKAIPINPPDNKCAGLTKCFSCSSHNQRRTKDTSKTN